MSVKPARRKWSPKQRRFIQWLVLPERKRTPKTQAELACELNLRPETLSRWKNLPGFYIAVGEAAFRRLEQRMPAVLDVIGEKAEAGDYRFVKLLFELNEKFKQRFGEDGIHFTEGEFAKAAIEVNSWLSERFGNLQDGGG
jgi:hypothetical protein